jgi:hypothetical protein
MRGWVAVALLASCNEVYSLDQTRLPPPDAALRCPDIGATSMDGAPHFSRKLEQVGTKPCQELTASVTAGIAIAACRTSETAAPTLHTATLDRDLLLADDFTELLLPDAVYSLPRLSADGDQLFVRQGLQWVIYTRDGATWNGPTTSALQLASNTIPSSITHGPNRRIVTIDSTMLTEYAFDSATVLATYKLNDLGLAPPSSRTILLALTADGLRLTFLELTSAGVDQLMYLDRPAIDMPFRTAIVLDLPAVGDPFMLEDCARLYYSSTVLGALFATRVVM